jgi:hypothetical protein
MAKKAAKKTPADSRQKKATKKAVKMTNKKAAEIVELSAEEKLAAAEAAAQKRELDHLHTIQKMNERVVYLANCHEVLKSEASLAKKQLDEAASALSLCISEGPPKPDPQKTLPFGDDGNPTDASTPSPNAATPAEDAWKSVKIGDAITLTKKQAETLESHGIRTVGHFEEVRSGQLRDYPNGLASLKGVGGVTITKWEDDIINWMMKNARQAESTTDPDQSAATTEASESTAEKTPPKEWQLIPFDLLLKLSDKHANKIKDLGVTTLGSLHLIASKANELFPGGISDLPLPAKTLEALESDLTQLFADMGVKLAEKPVDKPPEDSPAA